MITMTKTFWVSLQLAVFHVDCTPLVVSESTVDRLLASRTHRHNMSLARSVIILPCLQFFAMDVRGAIVWSEGYR